MTALRPLRRLAGERRGVAAVEFALVVPLLLLAWLSMAQLAQQTQVASKTALVAQSVADLATQINPPAFTDLVAAADLIIAPYPSDAMTIEVVGITFNSANAPQTAWRCTLPATLTTTAPVSAAAGLGTSGQSVIMVTVNYSYTPTITGGVIGAKSYSERNFNTPRLGTLPGKPC